MEFSLRNEFSELIHISWFDADYVETLIRYAQMAQIDM